MSCGGGRSERTRACDNPPMSGDGLPCYGASAESFVCAEIICPGQYHIYLISRDNHINTAPELKPYICILYMKSCQK